jgi:hypothetical protein
VPGKAERGQAVRRDIVAHLNRAGTVALRDIATAAWVSVPVAKGHLGMMLRAGEVELGADRMYRALTRRSTVRGELAKRPVVSRQAVFGLLLPLPDTP